MIVVKIGGSLGEEFRNICEDIKELCDAGERVVIVHGGGNATSELSERLGIGVEKVISLSGFESRRTTREVLEVYVMACAGKVNRFLVASLQSFGVPAVGLSGADGRLIEAERKIIKVLTPDGKRKVIRDDYSGKITKVNAFLLRRFMDMGLVPVIAPLAFSPNGDLLNVDGDTLASKIALELSARALVVLSDVPGLLKVPGCFETLIEEVYPEMEGEVFRYARGRMKKKVKAMFDAVKGGVDFGVIASGSADRPIISALQGAGTVFRKGSESKIGSDKAGREVWKWSLPQGAFEVG